MVQRARVEVCRCTACGQIEDIFAPSAAQFPIFAGTEALAGTYAILYLADSRCLSSATRLTGLAEAEAEGRRGPRANGVRRGSGAVLRGRGARASGVRRGSGAVLRGRGASGKYCPCFCYRDLATERGVQPGVDCAAENHLVRTRASCRPRPPHLVRFCVRGRRREFLAAHGRQHLLFPSFAGRGHGTVPRGGTRAQTKRRSPGIAGMAAPARCWQEDTISAQRSTSVARSTWQVRA